MGFTLVSICFPFKELFTSLNVPTMHKKSREDTQTKQSLRWPQILRCFVEYTILKERRTFLLQLVITPNVLKVLKSCTRFLQNNTTQPRLYKWKLFSQTSINTWLRVWSLGTVLGIKKYRSRQKKIGCKIFSASGLQETGKPIWDSKK